MWHWAAVPLLRYAIQKHRHHPISWQRLREAGRACLHLRLYHDREPCRSTLTADWCLVGPTWAALQPYRSCFSKQPKGTSEIITTSKRPSQSKLFYSPDTFPFAYKQATQNAWPASRHNEPTTRSHSTLSPYFSRCQRTASVFSWPRAHHASRTWRSTQIFRRNHSLALCHQNWAKSFITPQASCTSSNATNFYRKRPWSRSKLSADKYYDYV